MKTKIGKTIRFFYKFIKKKLFGIPSKQTKKQKNKQKIQGFEFFWIFVVKFS
jgi:hypothetical protein